MDLSFFFHRYPLIKFIDAKAIFKGHSSKELMLNKFDGHSNEKAQKKLAVEVEKTIEKITLNW